MMISIEDLTVSIPMPVLVVVEDVGWWQGKDGSAGNEPFRNSFPRPHCLADYQALVRLARRLKMRVVLAMVMGEWDRHNLLQGVPGATWMGSSWDNGKNQGPWLKEASQYLQSHQETVEIACHGLCHEFWQDGRMERSEFHDSSGRMRPEQIIRHHLQAFAGLLRQNAIVDLPRIFCPPALYHSFGNGAQSIQAILSEFGYKYVLTRFSRGRAYMPPIHKKITWECGVGLLERGLSPVAWHEAAAGPVWDFHNPILPLHWGNLLHANPERNEEVVDPWVEMLLDHAGRMEYTLAEDIISCWSQAAAWYLTKTTHDRCKVSLDMEAVLAVPEGNGTIILKIRRPSDRSLQCRGGRIVATLPDRSGIEIVQLRPTGNQGRIDLFLQERA